MGFAPADQLKVARRGEDLGGTSGEFFDAAGLQFVRAGQRIVPLAVLGVLVAVVLVVRVFVGWLCHYDVEDAMFLLVKHTVGAGCCESLLGREGLLEYDCKYQIGDAARFGLPVTGMQEVEQFEGGVLDDNELMRFDVYDGQKDESGTLGSRST